MGEPTKWRKRPILIEAVQWYRRGDHHAVVCWDEVPDGTPVPCAVPGGHDCNSPSSAHGGIQTLEGWLIVCPGDWIITAVKGERYPCKPDIFAETYEPDVGLGEERAADAKFREAVQELVGLIGAYEDDGSTTCLADIRLAAATVKASMGPVTQAPPRAAGTGGTEDKR